MGYSVNDVEDIEVHGAMETMPQKWPVVSGSVKPYFLSRQAILAEFVRWLA